MCGIRSAKVQLLYLYAPVFLLAISVVATVLLLKAKPDQRGADTAGSEDVDDLPGEDRSSRDAQRIAELEAALADAQAQIEELDKERVAAWETAAQLIMDVAATDETELEPKSISEIAGELGRMLKTSDFSELNHTLMSLGAAGKQGALELCALVHNTSIPLDERKQLMGVAALLPYEPCMDLFVTVPTDIVQSEGFQLSDTLQALSQSLKRMPRASASRYFGYFEGLATSTVAERPEDPGAWSMLGVMAFVHDSGTALALFQNPAEQREHVHSMINAAERVGNENARRFVEAVAQNPPAVENARMRAKQILAEW